MSTRIILSITLNLILISSGIGQENSWIKQNSQTMNKLNDVFFINYDTGWVVGNNGIVLKTIDGGDIWNVQTSQTSYNLNAVYFINSQKGWIVGDHGIYFMTTNSGDNWISSEFKDNNLFIDNDLGDIFFLNDTLGWICGYSIYTTNDGGNIWDTIEPYGHYSSIRFYDENIGWVGGENIKKSIDGGMNWNYSHDLTTHAISLINENTIIAVGSSHLPQITTNGGTNWELLSSDMPYIRYDDVFFVNDSVGWICGMQYDFLNPKSTVLKTNDGGINWSVLIDTTKNWITSIYFVDELNGWIVGGDGTIFKTTNGGIVNIEENIYNSKNQDIAINNYPNPFTDETTFFFNINRNSKVHLSIFNCNGELLSTILSQNHISGSYLLKQSFSNLAAGIYFYQLKTTDFVITNSMIKK